MSDEKSRAEFEVWAKSDEWLGGFDLDKIRAPDGYYDDGVDSAFNAWQASRATLVVKLPFKFGNGQMKADSVIAALTAAGITVK